ncbi:MAG: helix-turn-helix domain-containing protein [Ignavibacteriaceae bacterium]
MDLVTIIILIGIGQGFFVSVLLLTLNRGNKTANRLLGILLILFSLSISGFMFLRTDTYKDFPFLIGLPSTVIFLFGPLFYFYVKELTSSGFKFRKQDALHFIPFIALILFRLPFYLEGSQEKLNSLKNIGTFDQNLVILILQIIHLFIYLFFVKKVLNDYETGIKSTISSLEKINLRWISVGMNAFLIIFGIMTIFILLFISGLNVYSLYVTIIPLLVSIVILAIGYFGLTQPIIIPTEIENSKSKKYERSSLTSENSEKYLNKLLNIMETEKPFLNNDLTLQKLSEMLSISQHHLSQIINEKLNQNFFDLINSYRVEEAKILLIDKRGELLTILAIAEEVGFNSKSAFNIAFKKYTSMTPSQFKKQNLP